MSSLYLLSLVVENGFSERSRHEQIAQTNQERKNMTKHLTAIIEREGDGYVSLCAELDIASQGDTVDEARNNLKEALELFFESADAEEIQARLH
jgi:predicted RNase H-like HicB family nuclease